MIFRARVLFGVARFSVLHRPIAKPCATTLLRDRLTA
jgi:hypothetical protein